jgi:hypothetical protein
VVPTIASVCLKRSCLLIHAAAGSSFISGINFISALDCLSKTSIAALHTETICWKQTGQKDGGYQEDYCEGGDAA